MTRRPRPQTRDVKVTREQFDLAVRRTECLLDRIGMNMPLRVLLANAYLNGLADAAEVIRAPAPHVNASPSPAKATARPLSAPDAGAGDETDK